LLVTGSGRPEALAGLATVLAGRTSAMAGQPGTVRVVLADRCDRIPVGSKVSNGSLNEQDFSGECNGSSSIPEMAERHARFDAARCRPDRPGPATTAVGKLQKSKAEWATLLPQPAYRVLFEEDTERAGSSPLNQEKGDGTFVCAACYLPLFDSSAKYESGTGWPSFWQHLPEAIATRTDFKLIYPRTEYHCAAAADIRDTSSMTGRNRPASATATTASRCDFVPRSREAAGTAHMRMRLLVRRCCCSLGGRRRRCRPGRRQAGPETDSDLSPAAASGASRRISKSCRECLPPSPAIPPAYGQSQLRAGQLAGNTGHTEAVRVSYDPRRSAMRNCSTTSGGTSIRPSGTGSSATSARSIAAASTGRTRAERKAAESSRDALLASGKVPRIETEIAAASAFYPAEEYHQDYYKKNSVRYAYYRLSCGRDARLKQIWGGAAEAEARPRQSALNPPDRAGP
jgi:peptide methionine sulfoxide reductase MsrB